MKYIVLFALVIVFVPCVSVFSSQNQTNAVRCADVVPLGQDVASLPQPHMADVRYGPYARNVMDVYLADGQGARPALLVIHGGGFISGDKVKFRSDPFVRKAFDSGVSLFFINYRFVSTDPFPAPFVDGVRALQFIRYNAKQWNIDPERIAAYGGSAGANIAIWIATQDELADPGCGDPVGLQSSRLSCVIGKSAQTFNDPELILEKIGGNPGVHPSFLKAFGVSSIDEVKTNLTARRLAHDCSAIYFVTPDDAPLYLIYPQKMKTPPLPPDAPVGESIHHAMFGMLMKEKYEEGGVECVVFLQGPDNPPDPLGWLHRQFLKTAQEKR